MFILKIKIIFSLDGHGIYRASSLNLWKSQKLEALARKNPYFTIAVDFNHRDYDNNTSNTYLVNICSS